MTNLPALGLATTPWQANPTPAAPSGARESAAAQPSTKAAQASSPLAQRVSQLGRNTVDLAQNLLGKFAESLFGDAAKGMKVEFDSFSLSAESTASAAAYQSRSSHGSTSAAAFRLEDASSFSGRGKLTTADGKVFEFEIEVRYQSVQEAAFTSSQQQLLKNDGAEDRKPPAESGTATPAALNDLRSQFAGIASDLLAALSAEPARQPFSMSMPQDNSEPLQLLGDLALKLLDLPGGPRYVDLAKADNTEPGNPGLTVRA
ncbi:hypothetical protein [Chitinilyticum piscinae]|uniref:Uncharacterized protein n=1 Tax=Chitinilyticum piscinae TaxID=2866724 RepID=A0A8J7FJ96_9NEIS|nr:hypothetical protein [Chitinilyticum piscinae]MBE9608517.1 hypothetical protein [Chitinilyticum piscinae]